MNISSLYNEKNQFKIRLPISQAAYRKNRSTTEYIFATKLIIERTLSPTDETVYLLLLDMSKAFDSIKRNTLIDDLKNVLNQDERHLIRILLDVKIAAKCGNYKNRFFSTDTGTPQEIVQAPVSLLFTWLNHLKRLLPMTRHL